MRNTENPHPDDATKAQLANHLDGRPIRYSPNRVCSRCDAKNSLRIQYTNIPLDELADETLEAGERINFTTIYRDSPLIKGVCWSVRALFHKRHLHKSEDDIAVQGTAQAFGSATLTRATDATVQYAPDDEYASDDELVLTDVAIDLYSPPDQGRDDTASEREEMVVSSGVGDRPDWPEEENEWRRKLIQNGEE